MITDEARSAYGVCAVLRVLYAIENKNTLEKERKAEYIERQKKWQKKIQ